MFQKNNGSNERGYSATVQLLVFTALGLAAYFSGSFSPVLGSILYTLFAVDGLILSVFSLTAIAFSTYGIWLAARPEDGAEDSDSKAKLRETYVRGGFRSMAQLAYLIVVFAVVSLNYWQ